jgi:ribosomal protein S1
MTEMPLNPGDEIDVVVTTVAPFGVLVRTDAGVDGLVRGERASLGAAMHVRVLEVDDAQQRFSAEVV